MVITGQAPAATQKKRDFLLDTTWAGGGHRGSVASLPCPNTSTPAPAWAAGPNSRREAPEGNAPPFQAALSVVLSPAGGNHSHPHAHRGHPVPERGRAGLRGAAVLRLWRGTRAHCPTPTEGLPVSPPGPLSEAAPPPQDLLSSQPWPPAAPSILCPHFPRALPQEAPNRGGAQASPILRARRGSCPPELGFLHAKLRDSQLAPLKLALWLQGAL